MTLCANCNGEGLVGQGEKPWLKQGKLETCKACTGTGNVEVDTAEEEVKAAENPSQDSKPVDNSSFTGESSDGSADDLAKGGNGPFSNDQVFEVGATVEFFITNPEDKYFGNHVVTAARTDENGNCVQTDKGGEQWINVHWFQPVQA